jgi:hypothetical protein
MRLRVAIGTLGLMAMFTAALSERALAVQNKSGEGFVWLDAQRDAATWHGIEAAFAPELKPDSAQETMPYEPMTVKKVDRVATIGDSALVLIEKRLSEHARYRVVDAYNYNLKTQQKHPIRIKWSTWDWKYDGTGHFEPGPADILFTFQSCVDCDETLVLASYAYQADGKVWRIRTWVNDDQGIFVGGKQESQKGQVVDDCVFAVQDFENLGTDQVVDFCRRKEQSPDPPYHVFAVTYRADVFQMSNGRAAGRSTKSTTERKKLLAEICRTQGENELCGQASDLEDKDKKK